MSEQMPDPNNRTNWLDLKYWLAKLQGKSDSLGTDGSSLTGASQLEPKPGLNQKPSLTDGQSGGGTTPPGQSVPKE